MCGVDAITALWQIKIAIKVAPALMRHAVSSVAQGHHHIDEVAFGYSPGSF